MNWKQGLGMCVCALSALCIWSGRGEEPPLPPGYTGATNHVNAGTINKGKVRTFAKGCPECGQVCVSTNLLWNGGSATERWGVVRFQCTETNCGEVFTEEIKEPVKKSGPMVEIKSKG